MKLVHLNGIILARTEGKVVSGGKSTIFEGTEEECAAEVARLGLKERKDVPLVSSQRKAAVAFFDSLAPEVKAPFIPVFQAVLTIRSDKDAATAIAAVEVPSELAPVKAQILSLLNPE